MDLSLDPDQQDLLQEILNQNYRDLRYEVADTDNTEFKQQLRVREERVRILLELVGGPLPDRP